MSRCSMRVGESRARCWQPQSIAATRCSARGSGMDARWCDLVVVAPHYRLRARAPSDLSTGSTTRAAGCIARPRPRTAGHRHRCPPARSSPRRAARRCRPSTSLATDITRRERRARRARCIPLSRAPDEPQSCGPIVPPPSCLLTRAACHGRRRARAPAVPCIAAAAYIPRACDFPL